jgi:hypothetical protein
MPGIFIRRENGALVPMKASSYESEGELQRVLERYPELLLGAEIDEVGAPYLLIRREAGIPEMAGGPDQFFLDHMFVDREGIPTLVEVKRATDSRIRREVVGQMFDYAANVLRHWPPERMQAEFEARCADERLDEVNLVRGVSGLEYEDFWTHVKTNLAAKRLRLIFVADEIPPTLRTIVEFLNEQMTSSEVIALEVRQHVGEGLTMLVSQVIGRTTRSAVTKREPWTEQRFFETIAERDAHETWVARQLFDWAASKTGRITMRYGRGATVGYVLLSFDTPAGRASWLDLSTLGTIGLAPAVLEAAPPFDDRALRIEFVERVNAATGSALPIEIADRRDAYRSIHTRDLSPEELKEFIRVQDWLLDQIST